MTSTNTVECRNYSKDCLCLISNHMVKFHNTYSKNNKLTPRVCLRPFIIVNLMNSWDDLHSATVKGISLNCIFKVHQ